MKKIILAIFLISSSFVCVALTIAKAPILFKGMDEVPITSICTSEVIPPKDGRVGLCIPNINEYVGEEIIRHSKDESYFDYSRVEYDIESKKVMSLTFVMRYGVLESVKEILEIKYGKSQKDRPSSSINYWYGDKDGAALMYLTESEQMASFLGSQATPGQTTLVIITAAMRKVQDAVEARKLLSMQEKKIKSLKGL